MKRLTLIALFALLAFLSLWAWCHFGHSHPRPGLSSIAVNSDTSTGLDATQLTAIIGSIISALVALMTGFQNLVALFRKKPANEAPVTSA